MRGARAIGPNAAPNGLVQRGDIRFWIDEEVIADWIAPWRKGPGGQRRYSNTAIVATLTLGSVSRLPLRQAEGFVRSLFALMGAEIPVPDHNRRGPWPRWGRVSPGDAVPPPPDGSRRAWRKLQVSVDPATSEIVSHVLTDSDT